MRLSDLVSNLDNLFKKDQFIDKSINGLQVPGKGDVKKILTGVSISKELIEKAVEKKCDSVIVHHGMFWGEQSYPIQDIARERFNLLSKNGISLIAYHLPLDAHRDIGNNYPVCRDFCHHESGFDGKNIKDFGSMGDFSIGASFELNNNLDIEFLKEQTKLYYEHEVIHLKCQKEKIKKIAIVSGAGANFLKEAAVENIDLLITGEAEEWSMHEAIEHNVNLFACGHYATERIGIQMLNEYLNKKLNIESVFFDIPNPI